MNAVVSDPVKVLRAIPFAQLRASTVNVRKSGGVSIDDLSASILAHGLIQNLSVVEVGDVFEVVAGGRRLAALSRLVEQGKLPADVTVPCRLVSAETAHESSLAENIVRQAMHPADEFDAFAKLARDEELDAAAIADRFGTTELHVRKRLKLANVAPEILAQYRGGNADLEQVMALALTDDQDLQRRVWGTGKKDAWKRNPHNIKRALTEGEARTDSTIGKYVGVEAYEAAGGLVRRDLFGDEREAYFTDVGLLHRLAGEKLQRTADKIAREGWLWTETRIDFDYSERSKYGRASVTWKGTRETYSAEAKANAGAVVSIGYNGQAEIHRGLVRPEDRKAAARATGEAVTGGRKVKDPTALPFAQVQRLQGVRTAALRAELCTKPRVALAALAADLVVEVEGRMLRSYGSDDAIVRIGADNHCPAAPFREGLDAAIPAEFTALGEQWLNRIKEHRGDVFGWLLQQPESTTHELLAYITATRIVAGDLAEKATDKGQCFTHTAGVDMATHWTVSEAWLAPLPKGYILAAVGSACGKKAAEPLAKLKKADRARRAAELLAAVEPKWLPKPLRAPKPKTAKKRVEAEVSP